jgi:hypothetical protein
MKAWTLLLTALILGACASQPEANRPDWSAVGELEKKPVTDPRALPALCEIPWPATAVHCWAALDAFDVIAAGNTTIAQANANALRNTEGANDALIQAGQLQQQLSDFYRELLEDERQARWIDGMLYKAIIGLGVVAVAL